MPEKFVDVLPRILGEIFNFFKNKFKHNNKDFLIIFNMKNFNKLKIT